MYHRGVIINDLQIPFQCKPVLRKVIDFIDDFEPDTIVLNGDIVDCYSISDFNKDPLTEATLAVEIKQARSLMKRLEHIDTKIWIGGNHEDRIRRFIWKKAPAFAGISALDFPELFGLGYFGFAWYDYGEYIMLGKLLVTHGNVVRKHSGATARAHFESYGTNVIVGHTHRLGAYYKTRLGKPYVAYENGCLCNLNPRWVHNPDWQHGFSTVEWDDKSGLFMVKQIPIIMYGRSVKLFA